MLLTRKSILGIATLLLASTAAFGAGIPYPNPGTPIGDPPGPPLFTATGGVIEGWFYGASAGYTSELYVIVDPTGLNLTGPSVFKRGPGAAGPTVPGDFDILFNPADYGNPNIAGLEIVFALKIWTDGADINGSPSYTFLSNGPPHIGTGETGIRTYAAPWSDNTTGGQIPSTAVTIPSNSPNTYYVGFEDLLTPVPPDYDFNDHQFVFRGLLSETPIPEPSTWAMMLTGMAGLGLGIWRRRRNQI